MKLDSFNQLSHAQNSENLKNLYNYYVFFFLFVKAMWLMLQVNEPEDFVIATSESHTVREFLEIAFNKINKEIITEKKRSNSNQSDRAHTQPKRNIIFYIFL